MDSEFSFLSRAGVVTGITGFLGRVHAKAVLDKDPSKPLTVVQETINALIKVKKPNA